MINGEVEGSLTARVMGTSGRVVEADTRVTGGTDGRVLVLDASVTEANGRVAGVDGRATGAGGRVEGVTVLDPISFFMMIAWFCWMATGQSFNNVSTSGSTTKWVEKAN